MPESNTSDRRADLRNFLVVKMLPLEFSLGLDGGPRRWAPSSAQLLAELVWIRCPVLAIGAYGA